ncbi:MAG: radical SAM protein, partial [Blastocatellia bacterium]
LLPNLGDMGVEVQLVTSAVRPIPLSWRDIPALHLSVSIDGLQPDHDVRRAPATYERILKNIHGHQIIVHCTITHQMTSRPGYFDEFLEFWSERDEVRKIWFSLFTPQVGEQAEEILTGTERKQVLNEIRALRPLFPKLQLPDSVIRAYLDPPKVPEECIFAQTTLNFTADLKSRISPCQFGGNPSCSECGCMASAGFQAVGAHKLAGVVPLRAIFNASGRIGKMVAHVRQ